MTYIICLSYLSIPAVLSLTANITDYKLITDQPSIAEFLREAFPHESVVVIDMPPVFNGLDKILAPVKLKDYKAGLMEKLGRPKNISVYFFYNAFGYHISWWLNKVSADNEIYYKPDIDMSMWKTKYTVKSVAKQFWTWLNYSSFTIPVWGGAKFFYKVSDSFLKKNKVKIVSEIPMETAYIKQLLRDKFNITNRKYLLLVGNTVSDNMVTEEEYIAKNDALIDLLKPENVAIKMHPRFDFLYSKERECLIIPKFVPANIIFGSFDVVIGYASAAIFEAANDSKTAIALVNLFEPVSNDNKTNYINYLNGNLTNGASIFYPSTVGDIEKIIFDK